MNKFTLLVVVVYNGITVESTRFAIFINTSLIQINATFADFLRISCLLASVRVLPNLLLFEVSTFLSDFFLVFELDLKIFLNVVGSSSGLAGTLRV